jgi:sulfite exporter TauE/SafE
MGLTGSFSGIAGSIEGMQNITMAAIGIIMILLGAANLGYPFLKRKNAASRAEILSKFMDAVARIISFISETHTPGAFYVIGMTTGFMPCGLLYTAYIAAAGAGAAAGTGLQGFLAGMIMMLFFGLGTTPSLLLIGRLASLRTEWIRRRLYIISALFMMTIGAVQIYRSAVN